MGASLNGFDILTLVLGANILTLWGVYGFWRLTKNDRWDRQTILALGVPGVVMMVSAYLSTGL
ncbi:hypothetical protein [Leisingera sp. NJS204]|uniref:hypothetical protein n=1 Tax=Leisingera sp. NJS204 TaxID=2508307 RepID=UPI0010106762|nr:hypothetical protein [Leisingera sp. NJS204]QAX31318.1 hypothetical protein ETW24_19110 [Leisingera sp. NJS204]